MLKDVVEVDHAAVLGFHKSRVETVFAEPELYDLTGRSSHCVVVVHRQVLEAFHQATLHVTGLCSLDSGVHEAFPTGHRVEEELGGRKS